MSQNRNNWWLCFLLVTAPALAGEKMYVQSVKADLHQQPKLDSPTVAALTRGSEVDTADKQGLWMKVTAQGKTGWVSRLFLSSTRPVGEAELNKDIDGNLEKATRRRSSSYAVSASSRGLMSDERTRQGRALYRTDFDALDELEKDRVAPEKIKAFRTEAKLGAQ